MDQQFEKILRKASSSMKKFSLVENGDRILVGLSGGKDSMALLDILAERRKIFVPHFELFACHIGIRNVPYKSDIDYLRKFCEDRNIHFIYRETEFERDRKEGRSHCFLCSWSRRKVMFRLAEELECNKLALGHHKDDIAETLLMNQVFTGRFESMPPKMTMDKFNLSVIRPLCEIRESELAELATTQGYHRQIKNCPFEEVGNRAKVKDLIRNLEQMNPDVVSSLFSAYISIIEK